MRLRTASGGYILVSTAMVGLVMVMIASAFFGHAFNRYRIARESERAQRSYFIARGGPLYVQFLAQHHAQDLFQYVGNDLDHTLDGMDITQFPFYGHSEIRAEAGWEAELESLLGQTPPPQAVLFVDTRGGPGTSDEPEYRLLIWDGAWAGHVTIVIRPVFDGQSNYENMYEIISVGKVAGKRMSLTIEMDDTGHVLSWF